MGTMSFVMGEQPKKTIEYNWMLKEKPSFCFYTEEYELESLIAISLWNEALGNNFTSSFRIVNYTDNTTMCNNFVFFYPTAIANGAEVLGYVKCNFRMSIYPYCFTVIATDRNDMQVDNDYSITTTIIHEIGHVFGLGHPTTHNLTIWCIDDIMHIPHCIKTLQILPFHVEAIKCRYGEDGWLSPNYPECKSYEEYGE